MSKPWADSPSKTATYARRSGPQDLGVDKRPGGIGSDQFPNGKDADADYFGNLKSFKRTDNMAAEPNRKK